MVLLFLGGAPNDLYLYPYDPKNGRSQHSGTFFPGAAVAVWFVLSTNLLRLKHGGEPRNDDVHGLFMENDVHVSCDSGSFPHPTLFRGANLEMARWAGAMGPSKRKAFATMLTRPLTAY